MFDRDDSGTLHVVALSGGHDSSAMSILLKDIEPRPYNYVCTATGDELPTMFEHWRNLSAVLGKPIYPLARKTLNAVIREEKMLPNFRARFCTRILKIEPYRAFLKEQAAIGPVVSYVGLRADEEGRAGGAYEDIVGVQMRFPLREWHMGEEEVQSTLQHYGVLVPNRTDCGKCYHQRIGEWFELWRDYPDIYGDAVALEDEQGGTFRTPGRDSWPSSLKEMAVRFERGEVPTLSLNRMKRERMQVGACRVCSL